MDIWDFLEVRATRTGSKTAYVWMSDDGRREDQTLSFSSLYHRANRFGSVIAGQSRNGDRALLLFPPGLDFVVAFFACLRAGVLAIPLYPPDLARPNRGARSISAIAADASPTLVLTTASVSSGRENLFPPDSGLWKVPWLTESSDGPHKTQDHRKTPNGLAYLQYTSGLTREPRGVMVTHENVINYLQAVAARMATSAEWVTVSWLPVFHDMGLGLGHRWPGG